MSVADNHRARAADHRVAMAAQRAEDGGWFAIDQHAGDYIAHQGTAAGGGVALTRGR